MNRSRFRLDNWLDTRFCPSLRDVGAELGLIPLSLVRTRGISRIHGDHLEVGGSDLTRLIGRMAIEPLIKVHRLLDSIRIRPLLTVTSFKIETRWTEVEPNSVRPWNVDRFVQNRTLKKANWGFKPRTTIDSSRDDFETRYVVLNISIVIQLQNDDRFV